MILVKVFYNTDHEGTPVATEELNLDELPQSWYGPFEDISSAISFIENDYPDGDTDVYDMIADDFDVPEGSVITDPTDWLKQFEVEDIRPDSQELHGP